MIETRVLEIIESTESSMKKIERNNNVTLKYENINIFFNF